LFGRYVPFEDELRAGTRNGHKPQAKADEALPLIHSKHVPLAISNTITKILPNVEQEEEEAACFDLES
jgi:hypothetical protein